ncbi:DUF2955 domain-containing protein [Vibrio salinus]|uniref:DUF2955 domain-containing protein n=1 Tax=Vibrio salinus TaxID=2899784 RepID=UPI001E394CE7|nr:DUF2955 domain-containing protein [Vibrio salinus]MCE0493624.1 DUF2955 domain-containing protein [Vibrio salinus]
MRELFRKTLIIIICLMLSKMLHLNVSVYLVLFGVVVANTQYSRHTWVLLFSMLPPVSAAVGAVLINQIFASHPFIIWTICVVYFDYTRRQCTTNIQIRRATLPLFMIIFISTYSSSIDRVEMIPYIIRDVIFSALLVALVASMVNHLIPVRATPQQIKVIRLPVTGSDRLKMLLLVGGGLAFIMINEVTSAVFCLVPLITSAMQPTHDFMKSHSKSKMLSQIGGCSLAVVMSIVYSGTEINLFTYLIVSFILVYTILYWIAHSTVDSRAIHTDALMGFLIPYQLYVAKYGNDFGLTSIALRATELMIALLIIYACAYWLDRFSSNE